MKIVFVIDSWGEGNGGNVAAKRIVKELVARGHTIRVVTTGSHKEEGVEFYQVPGFTLPFVREELEKMDFLLARGTTSILREAFEGADLVQVQYPFFIPRKAIRIAREMGIPVTGASHVQARNIMGAMGKESRILEGIITGLFNFSLYKQVDAIQSPSVFAAKMLVNEGNKKHIRVISNGIPPEYQPAKKQRPDWFGNRFVLFNVGRHVKEKRQELLIDAVVRSKYRDNIQLILAGKGIDTDKLRKRGKKLPVKPWIEYASEEKKMLYLNTADMYVHASVAELESLTCLEAIGCGLPALISDSTNSAASQFALNDRFLFHADDVDSLTKKIDYWYEHRENLQDVSKLTLAMADYYRIERSAEAMEEFFTDAIEGRVTEPGINVATGHEVGVTPIKPAKKRLFANAY